MRPHPQYCQAIVKKKEKRLELLDPAEGIDKEVCQQIPRLKSLISFPDFSNLLICQEEHVNLDTRQ